MNKLGARNQIKQRIVEVKTGATTSHVCIAWHELTSNWRPQTSKTVTKSH